MELIEYLKIGAAVAVPIFAAWMSLNTRLTKIETVLDLFVTGRLKPEKEEK